MVRRNAYFNLVKLGATAVAFHRDFYGTMQDDGERRRPERPHPGRVAPRLSAGDRRERHCGRTRSTWPRSTTGGLWYGCRVGADGTPEVGRQRGAIELVQIPDDIVALRTADRDARPPLAAALRETLGAALEQGARADGITRDGWYVVRRPLDAVGTT